MGKGVIIVAVALIVGIVIVIVKGPSVDVGVKVRVTVRVANEDRPNQQDETQPSLVDGFNPVLRTQHRLDVGHLRFCNGRD